MLVKDNMSLRKRSAVAYSSGMLLILSLSLQCVICTVAGAVNANKSKSDSIVNGTHFENSRARSVPASESVANARSALKPTATGVNSAKSLPKEPVKPKNNDANPAEPLSTLPKANSAGSTHATGKDNQTAKIHEVNKKTDKNKTPKSSVTSKALKIKGAAGSGVTKINQTSPTSKTNATTTTTEELVYPIRKTTAYPILDEAESMFWNSEDDTPGSDVPDTNPAANAPATSKEGAKSVLIDLPEPIDNPDDLPVELLLVPDEYGSGETSEPTTATTAVPPASTTAVPPASTTAVPPASTTAVPPASTTAVPPASTTAVPPASTTAVPPASTTAVPATTTTAATTTTTVMLTTTGLTATVPPTYEKIDQWYGMNFDLSIKIAYDDDLEDPDSERYKALEKEVEDVINKAFEGCWGFVPGSANVLDFYNATWRGQITKGTDPAGHSYNSPEQLADEAFDSTGTNYNVTFETAKVFEHPDWVYDFISHNATSNLEDSTIANSSVSAGDMTQDAQDQIKDLTDEPCQFAACPSCYLCSANSLALGNETTKTPLCGFVCKSATEQCSIVDNSNGEWIGECTCKKGYLPIGGDCAKQSVVIGVSVGIALAFILGFLIIIIILCCKSSDKDKEKDKSSDSEAPVAEFEEAPIPGGSKDEPSAVEVVLPPAPLAQQSSTEEQTVRPVTIPTVHAEIVNPRKEDRYEDDEEVFQPNLSNVRDEDLSRNYAIARARAASFSLDDNQDYHRDNFYF